MKNPALFILPLTSGILALLQKREEEHFSPGRIQSLAKSGIGFCHLVLHGFYRYSHFFRYLSVGETVFLA